MARTHATRERFQRGTSGFEEQSRAWLQERLRLFCSVVLVFATLLYVVFRLLDLRLDSYPFESVLSPASLVHLAATAVVGSIWWCLRGCDLPLRTLVQGDALAVSICTGACILVFLAQPEIDTSLTAFLMGIFLLARAILVPSSARRTLAVSIPPVVVLGVLLLTAEQVYAMEGVPFPADLVPFLVAAQTAVLGCAVALAATASHVTFRLRRQAYEAEQLGQYVLERKIGEGAMGEVHRARHALLRRPTAIKLVR
ncbi:MAG: hypothetical protein ACE5JG_08715, partial [Planctomycetota bacterium]